MHAHARTCTRPHTAASSEDSILVVPGSVVAGAAFNVTVRAYAAAGQPIPYGGLQLTVQVTPSSAVLSQGSPVDSGDGNYTSLLTLQRAGSWTINATLYSSVYNVSTAAANGTLAVINVTNGVCVSCVSVGWFCVARERERDSEWL